MHLARKKSPIGGHHQDRFQGEPFNGQTPYSSHAEKARRFHRLPPGGQAARFKPFLPSGDRRKSKKIPVFQQVKRTLNQFPF